MTKTSFKKVSAAAIVAVLGLGAASHAAAIYSTGFELPFVPATGLAGQQGFLDLNSPSTGTGTISALTGVGLSQSAQINSSTSGFSEFYNTATAIPAAGVNGGSLTASFSLERATPGIGQSTGGQGQGVGGTAEAGFGIEVLNASQTKVLASVFVRNTAAITTPTIQASVPALFVSDSSQSPNAEIFNAPGTAAADGTYGTYSLNMNFTSSTFTVTGPGGTSAPFAFASSYDGAGIGAVTLSATNEGNDTAYFDNFSVTAGVPEPVSIGLVGMGSLMLMGRRRKAAAI